MAAAATYSMATGPQAFGMNQMMGHGMASQNANPLRPFFGDLPMMPSQGPDAQHFMRIEDLPAYYAQEKTWAYLSEALVGFVGLDNDWTVTLALPLDYDESQVFKWNIMHANQPLVDHVPHEGAIRLVQYARSSRMESVARYAIGLEAEAQMLTTVMGVQGVMQKMQIIKNATQRTNAMDVMQALADCHEDMALWQKVHGYRNLDRKEMMEQAIMQFGAVQKRYNGVELLVAQALKWCRNNGVNPDMLICPPTMRTHLQMVPKERTLYMYNGIPHSDGPPPLARVGGINVFETSTPDYMASINNLSMFDRRVATGEYMRMAPIGRHPASKRSIDIYSEDKDDLHRITMEDALKNCARFDPATGGGLSEEHGLLASKANQDRRSGLNTSDMFIYRDIEGTSTVATYAGQMELTMLPDEQLDWTASTAMDKISPADAAVVDAALQYVNDDLGRQFDDLSFAKMKGVLEKEQPGFQAAFGRVYATLKKCFGEHCAVLSPHRAYFPAGDVGESDAKRGQANLFYALFLFRAGFAGMAESAALPGVSVDAFDHVVAEARRGTVVAEGSAEPRIEPADAAFVEALNKALAWVGKANAVESRSSKAEVMAILLDAKFAADKTKWLESIAREHDISDEMTKSEIYKSVMSSGAAPTLQAVGREGVLVPGVDGKLTTAAQQTRLSALFDWSNVYSESKDVPLPSAARGRTAVLPMNLATLVGEATKRSEVQRARAHLTGSLLGMEARNAREMREFQACPPLLYREDRVHKTDSATQRACMLAAMFTRLTEDSLLSMIRADLHCWWQNVILRPWQRHRMTTLVLMKGGKETGMTKWSRATARAEQGAMLGIMRIYFTYYSKAIVFNPQNVILLENAYYNGYYGGGGHRWFSLPDGDLDRMAATGYMPQEAIQNAPALLCVMLPAHEELPMHFNILGFDQPLNGGPTSQQGRDPQYSQADYYKLKFKFGEIIATPAELMHFYTRQNVANTSVSAGFYLYRTPEGQLMEHQNKGHHGPNVGAGCAAVRAGRAVAMPERFPHQSSVFA